MKPSRATPLLLIAYTLLQGSPALAHEHAQARSTRTSECSAYLKSALRTHHRTIRTSSAETQRLFDEGLTLVFGFNHPEAIRSFHQALRHDPQCAMCWWGIAYSLGPNINSPMPASQLGPAAAAARTAMRLSEGETGVSRQLIEAVARRYDSGAGWDRAAMDAAYASAMKKVAADHPDDADVQALYAEAVMDTTPWNYWNADQTPNEKTREILSALDRALKTEPSHMGANHYRIHALELVQPGAALASARALEEARIGAGHLEHMPGHIYFRLGMYRDVTRVNDVGIAVDRQYLEACEPTGIYADMYVPHNMEFYVAAAALQGRSRDALERAVELKNYASPRVAGHSGMQMLDLQHFLGTPQLIRVQFGQWDEILQQALPASELRYARALHHYARALAHLNRGEREKSKAEIHKLWQVATDPVMETATVMAVNTASSILTIAHEEALGLFHAAGKSSRLAEALLRSAAQRQEALNYMEPPPWHRSVRRVLGAWLLKQGRAADAEKEFRADLEGLPENGWGLLGLALSLEAQGKPIESRQVLRRFEQAWKDSDISLETPVLEETPQRSRPLS